MVECNICDKHFTLNESLKCHGIEVHYGCLKIPNFGNLFKAKAGKEFGAPQVLF